METVSGPRAEPPGPAPLGAAAPVASAGPAGAGPAAGPPPEERHRAFFTGMLYGMLVLGGAVVAVLGAFHYLWSVAGVPAGACLGVAAAFAACWASGRLLGSLPAAAAVGIAWLVVAFALAALRPEGDLIIVASTEGKIFLYGGTVAVAVAVGLAYRDWVRGQLAG